MQKTGFTLAEVLITLAIIGVVAAMTVPTLMTSTRGKEYEVGAQKAMSTIANAMSMRYAMDGQTLKDYAQGSCAKVPSYLFEPPGSRPGEQPALQSIEKKSGHYSSFVYKLKDGMMVYEVPANMMSGCGLDGDGIVITVDTNGEKGPTRSKQNSWCQSFPNLNCFINDIFSFNIPDTLNPPRNEHPDIVFFTLNPDTSAVTPANQHTRNILATGNAMISQ